MFTALVVAFLGVTFAIHPAWLGLAVVGAAAGCLALPALHRLRRRRFQVTPAPGLEDLLRLDALSERARTALARHQDPSGIELLAALTTTRTALVTHLVEVEPLWDANSPACYEDLSRVKSVVYELDAAVHDLEELTRTALSVSVPSSGAALAGLLEDARTQRRALAEASSPTTEVAIEVKAASTRPSDHA